MGRKLQIFVVLVVMLLCAGAVGAYAWDNSRSDEIAEGVTIGGVDVGGMTGAQARSAVDEALVEPLRDHVVVRYDGVKYKLSPEKLEVSSDVDGMVDRALEESQEGGLPTRVFRYATGGEVDVAISPQISYSSKAIDEFIAKVAGEVNRDPIDATIEPSSSDLVAVTGQEGLVVNEGKLRSRIESAVQSPDSKQRKLTLPVETVEPDVTKEDLAARYPTYLTVSQGNFTVTLWKDLEVAAEYPIAVGAPEYPTPYGLFSVANKQVDPVWSVPNSEWAGELAGSTVAGGTAENPLKSRWMGVTDGVGFHGTSDTGSLGTPASHGCMRMAVPDIEALYDQVPVGTPVYIG